MAQQQQESSPNRLLILINGPKPDEIVAQFGHFDSQIRAVLDKHTPFTKETLHFDVVQPHEGATLPEDLTPYKAVLMSGSKCDVTDNAPWMIAMADWLRRHVGRLPILGICFGHQMLGHALGGEVAYNPRSYEVGVYTVRPKAGTDEARASDPVVHALPPNFGVSLMHAQTVLRLPPNAVAFFETDVEEHQLVKFAPMTYGTQFHPEYTVPFVKAMLPHLTYGVSSDADKARLATMPAECPESESIVAQFVKLAVAGGPW